MVQWDSQNEIQPTAWLLPIFLILMGAGELYLGVRGILDGKITWQTFDDAGNLVSETTLAGKQALLYSIVFTIGGVSWLPLSYLGPRALEAKNRRSSYFALPVTQRRLLKATLLTWILCKAYTAAVMLTA